MSKVSLFLVGIAVVTVSALGFASPALARAPDNWGWSIQNTGIRGVPGVGKVVVDPVTPTTLYVPDGSSGIYKSIDGGATWSAVNTGFPAGQSASYVTIDPNNHLTLYAVVGGQVYKSTNGGTSWSFSSAGTGLSCYYTTSTQNALAGVIVDPTNSNHLYTASVVSGCTGGIFESTNSGSSWTQIEGAGPGGSIGGAGWNDAWPLALDPATTTHMYFATVHNEQAVSSDGGHTWTVTSFSPYTMDGVAVVVHPTSSKVFVALGQGVVQSTNYGQTWTGISTFNQEGPTDIAFSSASSSVGYIVTRTGGIFRSLDSGNTWSLMSTSTQSWTSVAVSATSSSILYLGTMNAGVYKSTDGGATTAASSSGIPNTVPNPYVVQNGNVLYATNMGDGLYKSIDYGRTWTLILATTSDGFYPYQVGVDPTNPNVVLIGTWASGLGYGGGWRSADGGVTWTKVLPTGTTFNTFHFAPSDHTTVWAWAYVGGSYYYAIEKSVDNGQTWVTIPFFTAKPCYRDCIGIDPTNANVVYVAPIATGGPYKTTDGGQTWTAINNGITDTTGYSITVSPYNNSLLIFGSWNIDRYFRSTDGGNTWNLVLDTHIYGDANAAQVSFDATNQNTVYGGSYLHTYKSTDSGATWSMVPETGLNNTYFFGWTFPFSLNGLGGFISSHGNDGLVFYTNRIPLFSSSSITSSDITAYRGDGMIQPGDVLRVSTLLSNTGTATGTSTTIAVALPANFSYVTGSLTVDGAQYAPTLSGGVLSLPLGSLNAGKTVQISYQLLAGANTPCDTVVTITEVVHSNEDAQGTTLGSFGARTPACGAVGGGGGGISGGGGGGFVSDTPPNPPATGFSLVINNGASSTPSQTVVLTLNGGLDARYMEIANTSDFGGSALEPYTTSKAWTLPAGAGAKTVYARFRTASYGSASSPVSATITLNPTGTVSPVQPQQVTPLISSTTTGSSASSTPSLSSLLTNLKSQHPELGGLIDSLLPQVSTPPAPPVFPSLLTQGLRLGMRNTEVSTLQRLLATDASLYPSGKVTGYFGPLTRQAVIAFQLTYHLIPSSTSPFAGYVGPATRAKLQEILGR